MQLKSVDLPAPFGPIRPVIEPGSTASVAPSTARTPPKRAHHVLDGERRAHSSTISSLRPRIPCGRRTIEADDREADHDQPHVGALGRVEVRERREVEEARAGEEEAEDERADRHRPDAARARRGSRSSTRRTSSSGWKSSGLKNENCHA